MVSAMGDALLVPREQASHNDTEQAQALNWELG